MDNIENLFDDSIMNNDYSKIASEFGIDLEQLEEDLSNHQPQIKIPYSTNTSDAINPKYAYPTDSGFDLYTTTKVTIDPFGRTLVPTGLHFNIPDGYEIQVRSKSGLALKQGLMVLNSPGTVDQGYTGEIKVILFNTTNNEVIIEKGQKIAQGVISPVVAGKWVNLVKTSNIEDKDRSDKGFGSTGV